MSKTEKNRRHLENCMTQQVLNEFGLTGKDYGCQVPLIKKSPTKGRKVTINAYTLASAVVDAIKKRSKDYVCINLGMDKQLKIDLVTREVLYFNDKTWEESYLDNITFCEN